ncbi:hypothetical protein TNCV_4359571 [Trichonephila clavipes]|uniref:Uncharacterized protein n=1 Tax=Trichonephila clavipes TaxID=2585209 RepID=A0A8X7BH29_TRICX|nr:hypothetical protein TNCV_4359571 [Trichonephila clavipes]
MNVELTNKDLEQGSLEFEPNPRAGPESERVKGNRAQTSRSLKKPLTLNEWGLTNKDLEHRSLEFEPNSRAGPSQVQRVIVGEETAHRLGVLKKKKKKSP